AVNLIDGLDGLAGGVSLLSAVSILIFALAHGMTATAVTTLILAGAVAGFFIFNFSPASIFLCDSGSLFLRLILSVLVIALCRQRGPVDWAVMAVFPFALPLADTTIAVLRRLLSRRPLFEADRGHIHHKLLELGLTQPQAVWTLYGASAAAMVLGL